MELPTVQALREILADLEALPDSDPDKAQAIEKVTRQLTALESGND